MKVTIETNDKTEALQLLKASDMASLIFEYATTSRKHLKHLDVSEEYENGFRKAFELFDELIDTFEI